MHKNPARVAPSHRFIEVLSLASRMPYFCGPPSPRLPIPSPISPTMCVSFLPQPLGTSDISLRPAQVAASSNIHSDERVLESVLTHLHTPLKHVLALVHLAPSSAFVGSLQSKCAESCRPPPPPPPTHRRQTTITHECSCHKHAATNMQTASLDSCCRTALLTVSSIAATSFRVAQKSCCDGSISFRRYPGSGRTFHSVSSCHAGTAAPRWADVVPVL